MYLNITDLTLSIDWTTIGVISSDIVLIVLLVVMFRNNNGKKGKK